MATQLRIKRGTTDATAPTGLTAGEMAINLVDKKLYVGGTAGTNTIFLDSTAVAVLGTANTFTALNSFNAGISASGATFNGLISGATATFSKDITVNSITVGRGGGGIDNNVAVGTNAFYSNTTGSNNVGVGGGALEANTTGNSNVGVGFRALRSNTTGIRNVGVGQSAIGNNTDGSYKTAIGYAAGHYAGTSTTSLYTGTGGIYIGYQARGSTNGQTNEIVIGVDALGLGSNTAVIGATLQSAATIYGVLNLPSGLSASGATFTGNISAPNIVNSFNGATGAVTGVSFGANTFTALNSFSAGISASGATFTGSISGATATFSKDITVNSITVGRGGGAYYSYSTAVGSGALSSNTTGSGNVGVGYQVLTTNTLGESNVGVGSQALYSNTEGTSNVGVGDVALYNNTTGGDNVAIGYASQRNNSTGSCNTSVGSGALRYGSITVVPGGSQMTALGYNAGRYRATGASSLTTGTGGIYIGYQARGSTNDQTNEIVIGVDALGLGSNTAVIGATLQSAATIYGVLNLPSGLSASGATFSATTASTSSTTGAVIVAGGVGIAKDSFINSQRIGVGLLQDTTNLGVGVNALAATTAGGNHNTAIGSGCGQAITSGADNTLLGYAVGSLINTGGYNCSIGTASLNQNQSGNFNTAMGYGALQNTTASNNTAVGISALGNITTGALNTAIGREAGCFQADGTTALTTANNSVYLGRDTRGTQSDSNSVVIGYQAIGLGANTTVIGTSSTTETKLFGLLNLPSGLSAAGATFSAPISSTRMARHTSAAISAVQTAAFSPTVAQDGTVFYIDYGGKGMDITLEGLPIGWRAKFLNINSGNVNFTAPGDIYGYGAINGLGQFMLEAICISSNTYFVG